jgi:hypothetical protein
MRRQHLNALLPPSCFLPRLQRTLLSTGTLHTVQAQPRPSSPEIHRVSSPSYPLSASTPRAPRHSFGRQGANPSNHVSTAWFLTTLPLFSAFKAASLLHLASDHEVRCLSDFRIPPCLSISGDRRLSRTATTPRRIPLEQAVPHHCGHSLLGVTSDCATFIRRHTRDSQFPDHPATLYEYSWQLNPCVSARLRPSETGQSPRHRVYVPRHIHRPSLKQIYVEDKDSRLSQATNQVNTTKLQRPTNRVPAAPLSSRTKTEVFIRRFHETFHKWKTLIALHPISSPTLGFPSLASETNVRGCPPSRCCSVFKSVVSTPVSETSTPYPSWASISPLEFSQPSPVLP